MAQYVVKFYDTQSGWLHSKVDVDVNNPAEAIPAAIAAAGPEVATLRTAVEYPNGEGVPNLDNAATKAQLEAQLASIAAQLAALPDDDAVPDNVPRDVVAPAVNTFQGPAIVPPDPSSVQPGSVWQRPEV